MYMKSLCKLNLMQTPKWDASSLTHIYKAIRLIACGDESYLLDRGLQGGRKAVFIVQMCQVASTGSGGSDWIDSAVLTQRSCPLFQRAAATQCLQGQEAAFSITAPKKDKTQFYTSKPKRPRAEQVSRTRSLYSCYTSSRNEVNCLFYIYAFSRCFCCSGFQMKNSKPSVTEHLESLL